jgi:hypothetical protein
LLNENLLVCGELHTTVSGWCECFHDDTVILLLSNTIWILVLCRNSLKEW